MIRALFFDLDGTLLTTDRRLSDANAAALAACRDRGIKLFVATARAPRLANTLGWGEREFSLFDGGIYYNGGYVCVGDETRFYTIYSDVVSEIVACVAAFPGARLCLLMPDHLQALNHDPDDGSLSHWGYNPAKLVALDNSSMANTIKLLVYHDDSGSIPLKTEIADALRSVCKDRAQFYLTDHDSLIQITALESNKASAIRRVAVRLGLREDEIAVFGDDYNDLEMIRAFPESVAMGNACPELKAAAKYVTLSNDDDGIAHALKQLLHLL